MTDRRDFHAEELAGAYALGALDPDERLLVDLHIQNCARCARAIEEAIYTTALLAHAVDAAVPRPNLEDRLLERLGREESLRPDVPSEPPKSRLIPRRALGQILRPRLLPVAAAVLLILGVGTWNLQLRAEVARQHRIDAVIANAEAYPLTVVTGAPVVRGKVFVDYPTGQVLLAADNLPSLPTDRTYQLWLVRPDGQRDSGGVFRADSQGRAMVLITAPASLDSYVSLGVTNEPAGGSAGPTGQRVINCQLHTE